MAGLRTDEHRTILQIIPAVGWRVLYAEENLVYTEPLVCFALVKIEERYTGTRELTDDEPVVVVEGIERDPDFGTYFCREGTDKCFVGYVAPEEDINEEPWSTRIKEHLQRLRREREQAEQRARDAKQAGRPA